MEIIIKYALEYVKITRQNKYAYTRKHASLSNYSIRRWRDAQIGKHFYVM